MAKCLVLGGNGFIGSHLVDSLVKRGDTVRVFDRLMEKDLRFNESDNVEAVDGNFLNRGDLRSALDGMDYVFHFISTTTPISAENDPIVDITANVTTSVELFQECVANGVKRVIFASTGGAIYGEVDSSKPIPETTNARPMSPYAIGKMSIENYLRYFKVKHGLDSLVMRISNPYGERQPIGRKQGVIPIFLEKIYRDEPVTVLGDGSMVRDYVYVKDVADIVAAVYDKDHTQDIYNLGSGNGASVNDLVAAMAQLTGRKVRQESASVPPTFVHSVVLSNQLLESEFGVSPRTSLEDGLQKTWEYICANSEKLES